jgi:hypothetical protein
MVVGPAEVHPQQHLGPVSCLRSAGAGADREERAPLVVLAREQERRPLAAEVGLEGGCLLIQLNGELGVARLLDELENGEEVVSAGFEAPPQLDLGSEPAGLAEDLLGGPLVVPEAGLRCQRL